jgi:hypothetical protein
MKRRSKASGNRTKAPARDPTKLKHRAPRATISTARTKSPQPSEETEVTRLSRELGETIEQQTAMAEVLQIISNSPGELERVFESLLQRATKVCHASFGNLVLSEGDGFRVVAIHNAVPAVDTLFRGQLLHPHPQSPLSLAAKNKRFCHVDDLRTTTPYLEGNKAIIMLADVGGARTFLCVPLLKKSEVAGVIGPLSKRSSTIHRPTNCVSREFRRPSCHRHRERAANQRTASTYDRPHRGAGAANSYFASAASHLKFLW